MFSVEVVTSKEIFGPIDLFTLESDSLTPNTKSCLRPSDRKTFGNACSIPSWDD